MSEKFQVAILATIVSIISSGTGYIISSKQYEKDALFREKAFLAEKKYDIFVTYSKSVNESWAQYKIYSNVNTNLRQVGIDAFEEMRLISTEPVQKKADILNSYFIKLYPPFEITDGETKKFNTAFNGFKKVANEQFIFSN